MGQGQPEGFTKTDKRFHLENFSEIWIYGLTNGINFYYSDCANLMNLIQVLISYKNSSDACLQKMLEFWPSLNSPEPTWGDLK
jgi:hypothetical protein